MSDPLPILSTHERAGIHEQHGGHHDHHPDHVLGRAGERAAGRWLVRRGWNILATGWRGAGGEIQLTDSMIKLSEMAGQAFHAVRFDGKIYDCGSKIGFLLANIAYAMARDDLAPSLKTELKRLI